MAQRTLDDLMTDVEALLELSGKYAELQPGPARNLLHMLHFGLGKMYAELGRGTAERAKARRRRERRQTVRLAGETPLEFDGA